VIKIKALVLCAGYATRLYPLTLNQPKPLLEIAGKPMINYIIEKLELVEEINEIFIVTNNKFFNHFNEWNQTHNFKKQITIINDKTLSNEDRKGAIGDIHFVIKQQNIQEDLIVIGGDNLFEYDLREVVEFFKKKRATVTSLYDVKTIERAKLYGVVELDEKDKILDLVEKPEMPKSTLISTCVYIYPKKTLKRFDQYIEEGHPPDKTGSFLEWLHKIEPVYGYKFKGEWFDIGSRLELDMVKDFFGNK
jgi:glucose-1-phosphate thymidylyltransferase